MNTVKLGDRMLIAKSNVEANHWRLGNCNNLEFGAIEQDADTVILIHRPEYYGIEENEDGKSSKGRGELIVAKDRNGPTGTVYFKYNSSLTRIGPDVEQQKIPF
jgi:hypothetical protein